MINFIKNAVNSEFTLESRLVPLKYDEEKWLPTTTKAIIATVCTDHDKVRVKTIH